MLCYGLQLVIIKGERMTYDLLHSSEGCIYRTGARRNTFNCLVTILELDTCRACDAVSACYNVGYKRPCLLIMALRCLNKRNDVPVGDILLPVAEILEFCKQPSLSVSV